MCNFKISIALALYNGENYLQELLDSLLNQDLVPHEIVALDDCSTDRSAEIFKELKSNNVKLRYFKNENNLGPIATFKQLVFLCEGDYIAFCDQDDIWMPNKLSVSMAEMKKMDMELPCVVSTDLTGIDGENNITYNSEFEKWNTYPDKYQFFDILFRNILTGCTALINKKMSDEVKKMPTNIAMHDHWIAMVAYAFGDYKIINAPTILYRSHSSSVTTKENFTLYFKLKNSIMLGKSYLKENFEQVKLFKDLYFQFLKPPIKKNISKFLKLEQKSFFMKRVYAYQMKNKYNRK